MVGNDQIGIKFTHIIHKMWMAIIEKYNTYDNGAVSPTRLFVCRFVYVTNWQGCLEAINVLTKIAAPLQTFTFNLSFIQLQSVDDVDCNVFSLCELSWTWVCSSLDSTILNFQSDFVILFEP